MESNVAGLVQRVKAADPSYVAAADAVLVHVDAKLLLEFGEFLLLHFALMFVVLGDCSLLRLRLLGR
jgi:hypothetical protein